MYTCPDNRSWVNPAPPRYALAATLVPRLAHKRAAQQAVVQVLPRQSPLRVRPHHGPTTSAKPQPDSWGLPTLSTAPGVAFQHHPADHRLSAHEVEAAVAIRTPRQVVNPYVQAPLWPEANSTAFPSPESDDEESLRWGSGSHSMSRIEMVFTAAVAAAFMGVTVVLLVPH